VGASEAALRAEIDRTKERLAGDLAGLKVEAAAAQRKAMIVAGAVAGAYVAYRIMKLFIRRARS